MMRKVLVSIVAFSFIIIEVKVFAEPYYFLPNMMSQVRFEVNKRGTIKEKLAFLDETYKRLENLENSQKKFILKDMQVFRKNLVMNNLKEYTKIHYFDSGSLLRNSKRYYQTLKLKDIKADIHPNYLEALEEKIKKNDILEEDSPTYKAYLYVLHSLENRRTQSTRAKLQDMENFGTSDEYKKNGEYYSIRFEKLKKLENIDPYSKNDYVRIYSKILNEDISPESDYMKGFFYWCAAYKKAIGNDTMLLDASISHKKQEFSLSCEANSAKDLVNYFNNKSGKPLISETDVISALPAFTGSLHKISTGSYIWEDPAKFFVGSITGKQSANPENFSGYGVYADPIISAISNRLSSTGHKIGKGNVDEITIKDSINKEHPLVFWYLTPVIRGKSKGYDVIPKEWKTPSGKAIKGYLGEHTGILVGIDLSKEGKIENVYYFEGKEEGLQKMSWNLFRQTTSFFNETIMVDDVD